MSERASTIAALYQVMGWTCDFCHATTPDAIYPPSWGRIVRPTGILDFEVLDACQDCLERIEATGSYSGVPRGAYVPEGR